MCHLFVERISYLNAFPYVFSRSGGSHGHGHGFHRRALSWGYEPAQPTGRASTSVAPAFHRRSPGLQRESSGAASSSGGGGNGLSFARQWSPPRVQVAAEAQGTVGFTILDSAGQGSGSQSPALGSPGQGSLGQAAQRHSGSYVQDSGDHLLSTVLESEPSAPTPSTATGVAGNDQCSLAGGGSPGGSAHSSRHASGSLLGGGRRPSGSGRAAGGRSSLDAGPTDGVFLPTPRLGRSMTQLKLGEPPGAAETRRMASIDLGPAGRPQRPAFRRSYSALLHPLPSPPLQQQPQHAQAVAAAPDSVIAKRWHPSVTVLFAEIVGYLEFSKEVSYRPVDARHSRRFRDIPLQNHVLPSRCVV